MEKTTIYQTGVNHQQYEISLPKGHYKLDVYPGNYFYQLTLPNGKIVEGSIPALVSSIEYYHSDPELTAWLLDCLNWEETNHDKKADQVTKKFTIDGRNYSITFNPKTGMVNLHFPRIIIVGERKNIASPENFHEIYSLKGGMLSEFLTSVIYDSGVIPDDDRELPTQKLPQYTDTIKHYDIQGWQINISYNPSTEVIFLDLEARTEYSHLFTLPIDIPEFKILHEGRYKEAVLNILLDNGMRVE